MKKKGAIEVEYMGWIALGVIVLVLLIAGYIILKGKGIGAVDFIKNIIRFGG